MKKKIYVFLFDGFSDWEISYLTPEIQKSHKFELIYFAAEEGFVTSMGGLMVIPKTSVKDLDPKSVDLLVLPGGDAWEKGEIDMLDELITSMVDKGTDVAAICAATTHLGQLGLLDGRLHTSNDLDYLKMIASKYQGDEKYQNLLAITDQNLITANGIAPIEFAREIFRKIDLYDEDKIDKWYELFKNGIWSD